MDLGLIYDIESNGEAVNMTMTLTAVGCPVADQMKAQVEQKVQEFPDGSHAECEIVFDPPWMPEMVPEEGEAALSSIGIL